jgi:hypothetical protein
MDACRGGVRITGPTGPPGATLDLDFMAPGTLDPRLTFTRASTATYTDASGVIQSAATNAARWDYDPITHAPLGVLIEEARTNKILSSANFATSGWSSTAATLTAGQAGAPDGAATFTRMAETAAASPHFTGVSVAGLTASTAHTFSLYARMQQTRYLQIALDDLGATGAFATFDLQAGTISGALAGFGTAVIGAASMAAVGGGTYRCSIATTLGTATTGRILLLTSNVAAPAFIPSYAGNAANGLLMFGAQLEPGAMATSYIPTVSAAVTRAVDTLFISAANMSPWFTSPGGSWFAEFIDLDADVVAGGAGVIFQRGGGGLPLPMYVDHPTTRLGQWDGSNSMGTVNVVILGAVSKGVTTIGAGVGTVCLNGGAVASAALTTGYPGLVTGGVGFLIASSISVDNMSAGYIRGIKYWPRVLSGAEQQQVTT